MKEDFKCIKEKMNIENDIFGLQIKNTLSGQKIEWKTYTALSDVHISHICAKTRNLFYMKALIVYV